MRNERTKTIKFNMDKEEDRQLWEYLQMQQHGRFSEVTKEYWTKRMNKEWDDFARGHRMMPPTHGKEGKG